MQTVPGDPGEKGRGFSEVKIPHSPADLTYIPAGSLLKVSPPPEKKKVTMINEDLKASNLKWGVLDEETLSGHKCITFELPIHKKNVNPKWIYGEIRSKELNEYFKPTTNFVPNDPNVTIYTEIIQEEYRHTSPKIKASK